MKKEVFNSCIARTMKHKEGAKILKMHPKAFSRLKGRYQERGEQVLVPQKTGPKGPPPNRTQGWIEDIVSHLAYENRHMIPVELAEVLYE